MSFKKLLTLEMRQAEEVAAAKARSLGHSLSVFRTGQGPEVVRRGARCTRCPAFAAYDWRVSPVKMTGNATTEPCPVK